MLIALYNPEHLQALALTAVLACWSLSLPFLITAERTTTEADR